MAVVHWSARRRAMSVWLPLAMLVGVTPIIWKLVSAAFCPLDWLLACWCVWTGFVYRRLAFCGINLAAVLFVLGGAEALLSAKRPGVATTTSLDGPGLPYQQRDDLLGARPRPGSRTHYELRDRGQVLIDTVYTIDEHGLRAIPGHAPPDTAPTVVFFGCSYTYGEGVLDHETLPAQVARQRPDLRVFNFGFSGYGPHQMLANLESERVETICESPPRVVIYQMIPSHVRRVTGWVPFQKHGPRYLLRGGRVERAGNLDDSRWLPLVQKILWKSRVYHHLVSPLLITEAEIQLTVAILDQARREVSQRFPGASFHVLLWTRSDTPYAGRVRAALEATDLKLHLVTEQIPELRTKTPEYFIPGDGHPNGRAYSRLAEMVCEEIVRPVLDGTGEARAGQQEDGSGSRRLDRDPPAGPPDRR